MVSEDRADYLKRVMTDRLDKPLAKRFYTTVSLTADGPPFGILLDNRTVRTPGKAELAAPCRSLADAIVAEWQAQDNQINPAKMPLTRLCNMAIDGVAGDEERIVDEIISYAATDLVCYRADEPQDLVGRQSAAWDPLLSLVLTHFDARFETITGLVHQPQPAESLQALKATLQPRDPFELTGLHNLTTLTGSCVIAVCIAGGLIDAELGWTASLIDEDYQIEMWGEDLEAMHRRKTYRSEYDASVRLLDLLREGTTA